MTQRRWLTDKQMLTVDRIQEQLKKTRDEHLEKYGPHECTPDLNDPWSTCDLENTGVSR